MYYFCHIATAFHIAHRLNKYRPILLYLCTTSSLDHYLRNLGLITRLISVCVMACVDYGLFLKKTMHIFFSYT